MSNTLWWLCTSNKSGGNIETASCLLMSPLSLSCVIHCLNWERTGSFLISLLLTSICQALSSGYHPRGEGGPIFRWILAAEATGTSPSVEALAVLTAILTSPSSCAPAVGVGVADEDEEEDEDDDGAGWLAVYSRVRSPCAVAGRPNCLAPSLSVPRMWWWCSAMLDKRKVTGSCSWSVERKRSHSVGGTIFCIW